jgi:hypothetical protein
MPITPLAEFDGKLLDGLKFRSKVYALFESIRNADGGRSHLRMRSSRLAKKLIPVVAFHRCNRRISRAAFFGVELRVHDR